ncbi:hypothetical protein DAEQUDRAFT_479255 [Daedalea quercina L-15889]|uniref:Geranylgeranyl pyrophosphate synthetase n=1 Tax=Daedalea quercina L-15889 TaxID=1314783 RepID=A0A165MWR0_9APHY|nr:hypothetical protein DAEQUDRAFT_479255 [Daedalea quercina L-15889]
MTSTTAVPQATRAGSRSKTKQIKKDKKRHNGLVATPLKVLERPVIGVDPDHRVSIENMTYIGSYSWVDSVEPTIVVPGAPPIWRDRRTPYTIPPDRKTFTYEDAYRMPSSPNLARMRAIDIMTEEKGIHIDWPSIDFITDRNALRKLLRWNNGASGKDFRIDLELVGELTVFLNRWEDKTHHRADPHHPGYGFSFEHASTSPARGCEGTTGHHRISSYEFGGLRMIVSYEVDACAATTTAETKAIAQPSTSARASSQRSSKPIGTSSGSSRARTKGTTLSIIRAGHEVPQSSLIELKSSSKISWTETYPQLYLGQIPHLYHGLHDHGRVRQIVKRERSEEALLRVDYELQANFHKLHDCLRTIQALVIEHGRQVHLSLVYEAKRGRPLEVYQRTSPVTNFLPQEILQRFE